MFEVGSQRNDKKHRVISHLRLMARLVVVVKAFSGLFIKVNECNTNSRISCVLDVFTDREIFPPTPGHMHSPPVCHPESRVSRRFLSPNCHLIGGRRDTGAGARDRSARRPQNG